MDYQYEMAYPWRHVVTRKVHLSLLKSDLWCQQFVNFNDFPQNGNETSLPGGGTAISVFQMVERRSGPFRLNLITGAGHDEDWLQATLRLHYSLMGECVGKPTVRHTRH